LYRPFDFLPLPEDDRDFFLRRKSAILLELEVSAASAKPENGSRARRAIRLALPAMMLTGLRNKMSDAHVATYKPDKHHAVLAVNAAKTLANFIVTKYTTIAWL